jgi:signal transduction histidine kinase
MTEATPPTARIMVVDDQPENLELLAQLLRRKGYEVIACTSGLQALARLETAEVDLILMDVNMPEQNGYETVAIIKQQDRFRATPVIFVSAIEETNIKMKAFLAGGVDYVTRPYQVKELLARISAHLRVTQQRSAESQEHEREISHLRETNQIKDDMIHVVSHDLQNPISVIVSHVDLLRRRDPEYWQLHPKSNEYLDTIRDTALRMARFVSDLLDVMRIEAADKPAPQLTSLDMILTQCHHDTQPLAANRSIRLLYQPPQDNPTLMLVQPLFSQAVVNLISNAIKYTDEGGEVVLYTERDATELRIVVRDNGLGIPEEDLPHLFHRFYRVASPSHRTREGTGLGLAIVKMIAEQHGGSVSVESQLGRGSRFTIHLPYPG